jgi:hypothetical protein
LIAIVCEYGNLLFAMRALERAQCLAASIPFLVEKPFQRFKWLTIQRGIPERFKHDLANGIIGIHTWYADMSERKDGGVILGGPRHDITEGKGVWSFFVQV